MSIVFIKFNITFYLQDGLFRGKFAGKCLIFKGQAIYFTDKICYNVGTFLCVKTVNIEIIS